MLARAPRTPGAPRLPALALLVACAGASGCLQSDQSLPFELEQGAIASKNIGPMGGTISLPSGLAIVFPVGALRTGTQITLTPRLDAAFPGDAGSIIPGTVFDVAPAGLQLALPAQVSLRLPVKDIPSSDAVRLGVAQSSAGRASLVGTGSYDATSGLLSASVTALAPVAAVLADDALPVGTGTPPTLGGGSFGSGSPPADGPYVVAATQRFQASCRPDARRCFSSGMVQMYASSELLDRLGGTLAILAPQLEADISFGGWDANQLPSEAVGSMTVRGTLRAQLGQAVSSYDVNESVRTGTMSTPELTGVRVQGNKMVFARTSDGPDKTYEYSLQPIGTGRLLTFRLEDDVELDNEDGSTTTAHVIIFVRLRG